MEDEKIVELFLARNEDALKQTESKYGSRLVAFSYGIVEDSESAKECVNDVYLLAWNSIPPHSPYSYFYAFLKKLARQVSLDLVRKQGRQKRKGELVALSAELETVLPDSQDVENVIDGRLLGQAISSFLKTLPEDRRNLFVRRYWYTDSVSDIARRYRMSEGTVKSQLFRTRNELKEYLKKEGFGI